MKTKILFMTFVLFCLNLKAHQSDTTTYKPKKNEISIELNFDPSQIFASSEDGQFSLLNDGLKFRYFLSPESALRGIFNFSYNNKTQIAGEYFDLPNNIHELKKHLKGYSLQFRPGYEKHFKGTRKLSPYIGGDFLIKYSQYQIEEEHHLNSNNTYKTINKNPKENQTGIEFGIAGLGGVDFYLAKNLYLGLEITYGFSYFNQNNEEYMDESNSNNDYIIKTGSEYWISTNLTTTNFRVGWNF